MVTGTESYYCSLFLGEENFPLLAEEELKYLNGESLWRELKYLNVVFHNDCSFLVTPYGRRVPLVASYSFEVQVSVFGIF